MNDKMRASVVIGGIALMVGGCASTAPNQAEQLASSEQKQVCVKEYRVGSHLPVVSCTAPKTDAERQQMIDDLRNNVRPEAGPAAKAGGMGG